MWGSRGWDAADDGLLARSMVQGVYRETGEGTQHLNTWTSTWIFVNVSEMQQFTAVSEPWWHNLATALN